MKKFLAVVLLLLVAFVGFGATLPTRVEVERSVSVNRPAATVFTLLNGFRTWAEWSPWATLDPAATFTRSGPDFGVGARLEWSGDPTVVGAGWQEIVVSEPWTLVELKTDIGAQGAATTRYEVRGDQLGSQVSWRFEADVATGQGLVGGLLGRYFGLFLRRWVGEDFDRGLATFKAYAEALPAQDFSRAVIERLVVEAVPVARVSGEAPAEPGAIADALATAFGDITAWALDEGVELSGQPMAITRSWNPERYRFEAAIPVSGEWPPEPLTGTRVEIGESPGGDAVRIVHTGSYDDTLASYEAVYAWMAAHGFREQGTSWEHYVSDPADTPPEALVTHIYFLLEPAGELASGPGRGSGARGD